MKGVDQNKKAREGKEHGIKGSAADFFRCKEVGEDHGEKSIGTKQYSRHMGV